MPMDDDDPFASLKPVGTPDAPVDDGCPPFLPDEAYAEEADRPTAQVLTFPRGGAPDPAAQPQKALDATPFVWRDPLTIPPRPWVYGRHMMRKQVSVTVAPGGVGKSSLTIVEGLCLATGRELLGEWVSPNPVNVWIYNLEDPRDELERRAIGAMIHHGIRPDDIGDRLHLDTGRERPLCTAVDLRGEVTIVRPEIQALEDALKNRGIDVMVVDPFISSHRVSENNSGAIDLVAKEWARLADRCNCAIELVHHTRKTGGVDATTEDGRGSTALMGAARSGRVLNKMQEEDRKRAGVENDPATYFGVDRDKANLAPVGKRQWIRMASVDLGQGDHVGVAERWTWPDAFDGVTVKDLMAVQKEVQRLWDEGRPPRASDKSGEWIGIVVADILGKDVDHDRPQLRRIVDAWVKSGALVSVDWTDDHRKTRKAMEVGEWASE